MLNKALSIAAIGGYLFLDGSIRDQEQAWKAFAQFTGFAVPQKDGVANVQGNIAFVPDRSLHFTGPFKGFELRAIR